MRTKIAMVEGLDTKEIGTMVKTSVFLKKISLII